MKKDFMFPNFDKTVCHEWGHILTTYLLGKIENVSGLTFEITEEMFWGHTEFCPFEIKDGKITSFEFSEDENVLVLFGGVVAENLLDYSKVFIHRGTDADKINAIIPKNQQHAYKERTKALLSPYKDVIERLTARTLKDYEEQAGGKQLYNYRLPNSFIKDWIKEELNNHSKP